jgi:putative ABC transport system permease protein
MKQWMSNFAYHVPVPVWAFICTAAGVLIIAFLCILYHSLKVSTISPVKSLKSD